MKAIVCAKYRLPDVLRLENVHARGKVVITAENNADKVTVLDNSNKERKGDEK